MGESEIEAWFAKRSATEQQAWVDVLVGKPITAAMVDELPDDRKPQPRRPGRWVLGPTGATWGPDHVSVSGLIDYHLADDLYDFLDEEFGRRLPD